jgi:hypothetical protein
LRSAGPAEGDKPGGAVDIGGEASESHLRLRILAPQFGLVEFVELARGPRRRRVDLAMRQRCTARPSAAISKSSCVPTARRNPASAVDGCATGTRSVVTASDASNRCITQSTSGCQAAFWRSTRSPGAAAR